MKKIMEKLTKNVQLVKAYGNAAMLTALTAPVALPVEVYAGDGDATGTAKTIVMKVTDTIVPVLGLVGVFFVLSGVFKVVQAYRNDNPEAQAGGAKDIVIGAVLVGFGLLWGGIKEVVFGFI